MARIIQNNESAPAARTTTEVTHEMGGATGPITKVISERRSIRRHWRIAETIFMVVLDILLTLLACYGAYRLRFKTLLHNPMLEGLKFQIFGYYTGAAPDNNQQFSSYMPLWAGVIAGLIIIFAVRRLYHIRLTGNSFRQAWLIITSTTIGMAFLITYFFFFQNNNQYDPDTLIPNSRLLIPFIWFTTIIVLIAGRLAVAGVMGLLYRMGLGETRVLVVGSGRLGKMVMQCLAASPNLGFSVVGFLHDMTEPPGDFGRFKMLGTIDDIGMVIRSMQVDEVIIALPSHLNNHAIRSVRLCERLGASFKLIPDLYELNLSRIDMESIEGIPLLGIRQASLNTPQRVITRTIDIVLSTLGLIIGSPLYLCIALAIAFTSPGPIIYRQERVGLNGTPFKMFKFRSMYKDADQRLAQLLSQNEAQGPIFKMREDPRVTSVGRFLRRTSLDEIPQLLNVLRGEMSLVGPRPPLPREVAQYEEWQKGRLAIKPGCSGLWQVRGRSNISFDEGVLMDIYYIENWSLRLYIQILLRTIPAILFSRGAY
ncbi:UDP-phosphate galactose phosphotransferase [Dictyobacter aurantiacus]|uniref:UDP-phosphate galactose phosphotransferase n=2 Tax=Dictyobacter aurantiacus TaxID=1936993 RepID=A0A401ZAF3_9CHLR|nr:UDP-phosphate galactose phosphotransferase [Dictyobacter aurantiacus]